jgi:UDP-N-acetylmuramate: L-alanyl-gamma-D-glutamyl-meso-diaminopimelate ligase
MGSVAAAMKQRGYVITGSDANVYPPMSDFLRGQGITIAEGYAEANIPADAEVVVIGNTISRGNPEAEATLDRKLLYHSLPEVMKEYFLRGKRNFVVSGTHGKTTTSSMLAWLLRHAGRNPGFMIGGLPKNLGRGAEFTESEFNVLEGDEYDTAFFDKRSKFLHYLPECVVINNIEYDHLRLDR